MEVKGVAYLARRSMLVAEFGEQRFRDIVDAVAKKHPVFGTPILATSAIDIRAFLDFNDAIVTALYRGDTKSFWAFGEKSADWALTQGPYKHLLASKSVSEFADSATRIYRNYFNEGTATSEVAPGRVDLTLTGVPPAYRHVYFEYSIFGYFKRGLELVGARELRLERIKGFSKGDPIVHYLYTWTE
jgi:hypothetical protein